MAVVDILGAFSETASGNTFLIVAIDYFSKWMIVLPTPNEKTQI